jgi:hypothetical protein
MQAHAPGAGPCGPFPLLASNGETYDDFGVAIAIDGDTVVVGAPLHDGVGAAYVFRWDGAGWSEEAVLLAADPGANDQFGFAVAISGETIIVGSPNDDGPAGVDQGSVYIFTRSGSAWTQKTKLIPNDAAAADWFGLSVAIDGDTAIVGAPFDDGAAGANQGSAYIFTGAGAAWSQQQKLLASDAAVSDSFGSAVAISGDTALVGASLDNGPAGADQGGAYVFVRSASSWSQQTKLTPTDPAAGAQFGAAVALDGDDAVVGSPERAGPGGAQQGAAYVFRRNGAAWPQEQQLLDPSASGAERFGRTVAISGDTAVVGAPLKGFADGEEGSTHVFRRLSSGWIHEAMITDPDASGADEFGTAVAIDGDWLVGGARYGDGATDTDQGSAAVFNRIGSVWVGPQEKILPSDAAAGDVFGYSIAIDGDTAVIGAPLDDVGSQDSGSAYVFVRQGLRWVQQARLVSSNGQFEAAFGLSVAIDGDTIAVGASQEDGVGGIDQGAAYVFVRQGANWTQQQRLTANDAAAGDFFGYVALEGDTLCIGAVGDDDGGAEAGAVYVFTRTGAVWTQRVKLDAENPQPDEEFGRYIALDGGTLVVGTPDRNTRAGGVHIFTGAGAVWSQQTLLTPQDLSTYTYFGYSVAIDGDTVVAGAWGAGDLAPETGAAYFFERTGSTWTQRAKLYVDDVSGGNALGLSCAIDGDLAIVGAGFSGEADPDGAAYIFERTGGVWTNAGRLTAPDHEPIDFFGNTVALEGRTALVGAWFDDGPAGVDQGSVSVFTVAEECLLPEVQNLTSGAVDASLLDAVNAAASGDRLIASTTAFYAPESIDLIGRALSISGRRAVTQPHLQSLTLAHNASLNAAPGSPMTLYGAVIAPQWADATLRAASFRLGAGADLTVRSGASLTINAASANLEGDTLAFGGSTMTFSGPASVRGDMTLLTGAAAAPLLTIERAGRFVGDGDLISNVANRSTFIAVDDTLIAGDLTNHAGATLTVQIGTLTLLGSLSNNGTIVGDLQTLLRAPQTQPGDGFSVGGDYRAGPGASLQMASDLWRVRIGGDFDVAINDHTRYDMAQAELRIGASHPTSLERMSRDLGAIPGGLDRTLPGHYPIGTLRLTGNVTTLVDAHDNDGLGQGACEALYVRRLIIDAGATLLTGGCPVYYETLINNGSVDDPANLIQIAQCAADLTGDGQVDGADLGLLLGSWGSPQGDLNGSGVTDGADLGLLLGAWGPCP